MNHFSGPCTKNSLLSMFCLVRVLLQESLSEFKLLLVIRIFDFDSFDKDVSDAPLFLPS